MECPSNRGKLSLSLSAYGRSGPLSIYPGYDALIQAEAGWADMTGDPDGPPVKSGLSLVDYATGLTAALAALAALFDARLTGRGRNVDTNLYDVALAMLTYPATWHLSRGTPSTRLPDSAHPSIVPFQFFATADGYIAIACAKEKFFRALAVTVGLPELVEDVRFSSFAARLEHRSTLLAILTAQFLTKTTDEWVQALRGTVPAAPVRSMAKALSEAELRERNMLVEYEHPELGPVRQVAAPFNFERYSPRYRRAPELGGDRDEILHMLGYDDHQIGDLTGGGAFGGREKP
ncbi:MAG: CaiB/BaiF CoA transferase family protein [Chloroflexota bacterium]